MSRYVALDGADGCGKSAQARALVDWLQASGREVVHVREPGSTPVGEALRRLLLAAGTGELTALGEILLFSAARAELAAGVIAPALARGALVVAERCYLSTAVYQLWAAAAPPASADLAWFFDLTRRVHGAVLPDAIFVLDVPAELAAERRRSRAADRFEVRGLDFQQRVREGYLALAQHEVRAQVVDAARPLAIVQQDLQARVLALLGGEQSA